ncbi:MAG: acyl-CoA dehydrogenase family protein [Novosphingobium sp.]|nr:acyl-CoA dehydrogenase family protein [Novosphingobium sp.]
MVSLRISEEQTRMMEMVARALTSADVATLRGPQAESWKLVRDLGIPLMRVSADRGGWAAGLFDAVLVAEAAGTQGRIDQVVPAIAAYALLDRLGDPTGEIARGTSPLIIAPYDAAVYPVQAVLGAGRAARLLWRAGQHVLIAELAEDGGAGSPVLSVNLKALAAQARRVAEGPSAVAAFRAAISEYRVLLAAAQAGMGKQAVADAAAYAREREVFGKPIGAYQGVAHALANALTLVDGASLAVWRAVDSAARAEPEAGRFLAEACWWAHKAALRAIKASMRVFGGYGMTSDSRLPHYYLAARDAGLALGDPDGLLSGYSSAMTLPDAGSPGVDFADDDETTLWADRAARFVAGQFPAEDKERFLNSSDNHFPDLHRRLAGAGLLYPDWPVEFGGAGASAFAASAVRRTLGAAGWPLSVLAVSDMVGKLVMKFGSPEAKAEILPRLAEGSAIACLGLSETTGGSDVFAARTHARHDGSGWIVNGQKVFTTSAHIASYVLLLTRSDTQGDSPAGITLFVAPTNRPGFDAHAVQTFAGERTNITFYSDFPVEDKYLIGAAGHGAKVLAATLTMEHNMGDYYLASLESSVREIRERYDALIALPGMADRKARVDLSLARADAHINLLRCLSQRSQWAGETGDAERWFGPMCKLFGTEAWASVNADLVDCFAPHSIMAAEPALRPAETEARRGIPATIYGGTSEIQRSVIAETALDLPRSR